MPDPSPAARSPPVAAGTSHAKHHAAGDYLRRFTIPTGVRRADGLPVPFRPIFHMYASEFTMGSRDEHEWRTLYQILAWQQNLFHEALRFRHVLEFSPDPVVDFLDYIAVSMRRVFSLAAAGYDYLALRRSEPGLAEAYAHADTVPRKGPCSDVAHLFLSSVVRQEAYNTTKLGAMERDFAYGGGRGGRPGRGPVALGADDIHHGGSLSGRGNGDSLRAPAGRGGAADRGGRGRGRGRT